MQSGIFSEELRMLLSVRCLRTLLWTFLFLSPAFSRAGGKRAAGGIAVESGMVKKQDIIRNLS
ncbi:hypothetical protein HMPREF9141_1994 [Prevotella multiformis DSM 16608]|uniref:Uncharacterized protein n=1 Tax=Prevotella multiformis DSM 16608 TaxID=888743 RepID=F0F8S7_9BACT|nr:hypothetical protein HMPREF9141_1994 [Prevotella multiformis DSM 16608]